MTDTNDTATPAPGIAESLAKGFLHGMDTMTRFMVEPLVKGAVVATGMGTGKQVEQSYAMNDQDYAQMAQVNPISSGAGNLAGQVLGSLPAVGAADLGLSAAGIGQGASLASAALRGATQGAAVGGTMTPADGQSRLSGLLAGAAGGGVLGAAGAGLVSGAAKLLGTDTANAGLIAQTAKDIGVPVGVSEVSGARTADLLNTITSKIPLGGFSDLQTKQEQALEPGIRNFMSQVAGTTDGSESAVENAIMQKAADASSTADKMFDQVSQAAKAAGNPPVSKAPIMDAINNYATPDDFNHPVVQDVVQRLQNAGATEATQHAYTIADTSGNVLAKVTNPDQQIAYQQALQKQAQLAKATTTPGSTTLGTQFAPLQHDVTSSPEGVSFDDMRGLRSMIGKKYGQVAKQMQAGNADVGNLNALSAIKTGIDNSLDQWGSTNNVPNIAQNYAAARTFYQNYSQTFQNPAVKKALTNGIAMQSLVKGLLTDSNPARVQQTLNAVGPENVGTVRAYALQNALTSAIQTGSKDNTVDLNKFITTLNKPGTDAQQPVWGDSMDKLKGLNLLMRSVQQRQSQEGLGVSNLKEATASGGAAAAAALGVHAVGAGPAAAVMTPVTLASRALNSPRMANILTRLSYVTPNTPDSITSSLVDTGHKSLVGLLAKRAVGGLVRNQLQQIDSTQNQS